jgi:hypothetical protein
MVRAISKYLVGLTLASLLPLTEGCGGSETAPTDGPAWASDSGLPEMSDVAALPLDPQDATTASAEVAVEQPDTGSESDASTGSQGDSATAPAVTVVVLPDTQYYASTYPSIFTAQTRWIAEQRTARHIEAVLHVGDVVDTYNSPSQWTVANASMRILDGLLPYVLVPGNHDTDPNRDGLMNSYFAPATMPWITGTMVPGRIDNNYALVDIGPRQWLVLGLEFGPRDAVLTWADSILKTYPDRPAIVVTHAYLYHDGNRYDLAVSGSDTAQLNYQYWIPQYYGYTASQGINDGEQIWQKLIVPNPNVRLVFSGHDTGAARLTSTRPDGSRVHQMLSDYQWLYAGTAADLGGSGYLRTLEFDYDNKEIRVRTYSPYLDLSLTDDANQFTVSLEP